MRAALLILIIGVCTRTEVSAQSCTAVGKFIADYSCTGYVVCLDPGSDTVYPSYPVNCPAGFNMRPTDMVCAKAADVCDSSFTCSTLGNFPNPLSTSTSSYISCIQGLGTMIIASVMTCPTDSTFNSNLGQCVSTTTTVAVTPVESMIRTNSAPVTAATAVESTSTTSADTTEILPTVITTTTLTIPTHRANSAAHIYSSYILILTTVISVVFYVQDSV